MANTTRHQPAQAVISAIEHPDYSRRDVYYSSNGLSKREEVASRCLASLMVRTDGSVPESDRIWIMADCAIEAADALFDALERPAREAEEKARLEAEQLREAYRKERDHKLLQVSLCLLSKEEYDLWKFNNDPDIDR